MPINRQFSLALEALAELKAEIVPDQPKPVPFDATQGRPAAPTLTEVLAEIGSLPREALFLGIASDGLPVLLNMSDPIPGPLLIVGDASAGKTALLKLIARAAQQTHYSTDVQFGALTNYPEEWDDIPTNEHHVGVFPMHHNSARDFVLSLASWAHANKSKQAVLLLIDDLEAIANLDSDALQNFRWLLLRGPARRVWPIVTLNAERYGQVLPWIPTFRTRIFGRIQDGRVAEALGADQASGVDRLEAGIQFSLRENGGWLRFWSPGG